MAKLAIEADGNIIGESFIAKPDKDLIPKLGILFGIIETYNINDAFAEKLFEAIKDLKTEFYLPPYGTESSPEKRFEEALARANRRLFSAFNESVEPIDLRNINVVIGLIRKKQVFLAQIGHGKAFLFHRKKNWELLILDILSDENRPAGRPNPEKLFSSVLSGEIGDDDSLLVCNEEFLAYFSQHEMAQTIDRQNPEEALRILGGQIKEKVAKANFYAIAIKPEAPEKILAEELPIPIANRQAVNHSQKSINRLLDTQTKTEEYLAPSMMPSWQKLMVLGLRHLKQGGSLVARQTAKASAMAIDLAKKKIEEKKNSKQPTIAQRDGSPKISEDFSEISQTIPQQAISKENIDTKNDDYTKYPEEPPFSEDLPATAETNETIDEPLEGFGGNSDRVAGFVDNDEQPDHAGLQKNIAGQGLLPIKGATKENKPFGENLINSWLNSQIVKFLNLRRSQQIILSIALILLLLFSQSIVWMGRAEEQAANKGGGGNKSAQEIQRLVDNAEAQNIFNDETGALASLKKAREVLSEMPSRWSNKELRKQLGEKIDSAYRRLQKITLLDNPEVFSSLTEGRYAVLSRTTKNLWTVDNNAKSIIRISESGKSEALASGLPEISKLSTIDDRYLALLASDGSFYRYDITKNEAVKTKPGKDYFAAKSITESPLLDPSIASSTIVSNISSGDYVFMLDTANNRVIVFNKNGALEKQFVSPAFKEAGALAASAKDKKIWVLSGDKIYKIDLGL